MTRTHPHGMRPRDERAHPVVQDAIDKGYAHTQADYIVNGLNNHDIANETRLAVNRALEHFGLARATRVIDEDGNACFRNCKDPTAPHGVSFRLLLKNEARKHVAAVSGGDPSKLKYNPHMQAVRPHFTDDGQWISGASA